MKTEIVLGIKFDTVTHIALDLGIVFLFILIGGLFVAAEIALISLRDSASKQLTGKSGERVRSLISNPNRFLAAAQVGVTFCGFFSAALGTEQLGRFLIPELEKLGLSHNWANTLSLLLLTIVIAYISLVFGELVPKRLAIYRTEIIAVLSAPVIELMARAFRPIIILLSKSTDLIIKVFGIGKEEERPDISEAELLDLVSGHTALSNEERKIVEDVFNASDLKIHEVMVPRTKVDFLDVNTTIEEAKEKTFIHAHSRFPVVRGSNDEVIGFLLVRDLFDPSKSKSESETIWEQVRPILSLPGSKGVLQALSEMRSKRHQIAIVLDEYGGTDGIITLEDLVETLVGEIRDEYDVESDLVSTKTATGDVSVDGLMNIEDLFNETGIRIPDGPYETLSGFIMHRCGHIPDVMEKVRENGYELTVLSIVGKRVGEIVISNVGSNRSASHQDEASSN